MNVPVVRQGVAAACLDTHSPIQLRPATYRFIHCTLVESVHTGWCKSLSDVGSAALKAADPGRRNGRLSYPAVSASFV